MNQQKVMCSQCGEKPAVAAILQEVTPEEKALILQARFYPETPDDPWFLGNLYKVGEYCNDNLQAFLKSIKPEEKGKYKVVELEELEQIVEAEKARRNDKERNT